MVLIMILEEDVEMQILFILELDCNRPDDIRYLLRLKSTCLSGATVIFSDFSFSLLTSVILAMWLIVTQ